MMQFFKSLLLAMEPYLLKFLQTAVVKAAVKFFFQNAVPGGLKLKVIKYAAKNLLFDKALLPGVQKVFRELGYSFDVGDGIIQIKRLKKASDNNDQDSYDDTIDDILS
jgi:hypothetical protein